MFLYLAKHCSTVTSSAHIGKGRNYKLNRHPNIFYCIFGNYNKFYFLSETFSCPKVLKTVRKFLSDTFKSESFRF